MVSAVSTPCPFLACLTFLPQDLNVLVQKACCHLPASWAELRGAGPVGREAERNVIYRHWKLVGRGKAGLCSSGNRPKRVATGPQRHGEEPQPRVLPRGPGPVILKALVCSECTPLTPMLVLCGHQGLPVSLCSSSTHFWRTRYLQLTQASLSTFAFLRRSTGATTHLSTPSRWAPLPQVRSRAPSSGSRIVLQRVRPQVLADDLGRNTGQRGTGPVC